MIMRLTSDGGSGERNRKAKKKKERKKRNETKEEAYARPALGLAYSECNTGQSVSVHWGKNAETSQPTIADMFSLIMKPVKHQGIN